MGGRGSSSAGGGGRFISTLEDWQVDYINRHEQMGNFGTKSEQIEYMRQNGVSEESISEMNRLLTRHGGNSAQQNVADPLIVDHLQSNDPIGQALKMQISMEESLYRQWMRSHPGGDDRVYRRGNRRNGVESWTTNPDGADMGGGRIGYDHVTTVGALMSQGYHILGGMGRHLGAPGESEVTMVKY